jgi:hypothetical protein
MGRLHLYQRYGPAEIDLPGHRADRQKMDHATAWMGRVRLAVKDYIWGPNEYRSMIGPRKKEAAPCSLNGAAAASIKLVQNYILTQFILQTPFVKSMSFRISA